MLLDPTFENIYKRRMITVENIYHIRRFYTVAQKYGDTYIHIYFFRICDICNQILVYNIRAKRYIHC